ncbi:MAG: Fic family protein [bacterium]|nr:Fic family protein [bacterium]
MFQPRYTITAKLLANIKRIAVLVAELNSKRFPSVVLFDFERKAREISAHASTSIEGNPLPLTEVKKILKNAPVHIRDTEREVLNYNKALLYLNTLAKKDVPALTIPLILKIHGMVMDGLTQKHKVGTIRQEPVFVNDVRTRQPIYLPPDHQDTTTLMKDLLGFVTQNRHTIDPLIVAGIFHRQHVIIHPFIDGNGRSTRLATKVLFAEMGLNTFNLFSFENYYNNNVTKYFQNVGLVGNYYDLKETIDFTQWLEYFTAGIIDELLRVGGDLAHAAVTPRTELKPYHQIVLTTIKKQGFIRDSDYAKLTIRARATRNLDFRKLIELDLIERQGKGRGAYYVFKK